MQINIRHKKPLKNDVLIDGRVEWLCHPEDNDHYYMIGFYNQYPIILQTEINGLHLRPLLCFDLKLLLKIYIYIFGVTNSKFLV